MTADTASRTPTDRYVIHNLFGPTVYQTDDRDEAQPRR